MAVASRERPAYNRPIMKTLRSALLLTLLALILTGCAAIKPQLRSVTTHYSDPSFWPGGTLAIMAAEPAQNSSLAFGHFRSLVGERLAGYGYQLVGDIASAQQVAIVSYGIDNGRAERVAVPLYGPIGAYPPYPFYGSASFFHGRRYGGIGATYYSMPQYGIVGSATETITTYSRALAVDIVDGASYRANAPKRLLELRTRSEGGCGTMEVILPSLVQAMFAVFPGEYGKPRIDVRDLPEGFAC